MNIPAASTATFPILKFFTYKHLPASIAPVSRLFSVVAAALAAHPPTSQPGAEVAAGFRKLLEAKDCFVRAAVDYAVSSPIGDHVVFDVYHPAVVEHLAAIAHETNADYCRLAGDNSHSPWEDTREDLRESARIGVRGVLAGNSPGESHELWLKTKTEQGWKYGPVKDFEKKEHPCFLPFEKLPFHDQVKDYIFRAAVFAAREALIRDTLHLYAPPPVGAARNG
jgi:hypothetical protein